MINVRLVTIPEPEPDSRAVLGSADPDIPAVRGDPSESGEVNLLCGACSTVLAQQISNANQLQGMVLLCRCGAYNETRV